MKWIHYSGFLVPLVFWATTMVCGLILPDYSHLSDQVSELGALGTKTQSLFTAGLLLSSALSIIFILKFSHYSRKHKINIIPVAILFAFSLSIAGAAIFPMPLRMHGIWSLPAVLLYFSPLLALILWKQKTVTITYAAIFSILIMIVGISVFIPDLLSSCHGLKQRFFHIGWSVWFIGLNMEYFKRSKTVWLV